MRTPLRSSVLLIISIGSPAFKENTMRYEFTIEIADAEYVDDLIICLARQGYAPYITSGDDVAITVDAESLTELK